MMRSAPGSDEITRVRVLVREEESLRERRALLPAWMLEQVERRPRPVRPLAPPTRRRLLVARGAEARIEALTKLKELLDQGVLTRRQFRDERDRLLGG
jgi:hypothetical protein